MAEADERMFFGGKKPKPFLTEPIKKGDRVRCQGVEGDHFAQPTSLLYTLFSFESVLWDAL